MRLNILIGGEAGQGINKVSDIVSDVLVEYGYFTFNYRDYPSLIRGGHNFNVLSISDVRVGSFDLDLDGIVALDKKTIEVHKKQLRKDGFTIDFHNFEDLGRNLNIALAGALIKTLGIEKNLITKQVEKEFKNKISTAAAEKGYNAYKPKFNLKRLKNEITIMTGSSGVVRGAVDSGINLYLAYPMTPATPVMHELAALEKKHGFMVFQPENEIAVVNAALGASFTGAKTMVGTSGGGFDLMCEALSMQGMSKIPLVVYLASRSGPGTGVPTYTNQGDLELALRGGHGEFPRIVIAPGDPIEAVEKTNEAFYLAEKFRSLAIILSDKHLAESEFSSDRKPNRTLPVKVERDTPQNVIIKASSYEVDEFGNTTSDPEIITKNADERVQRYHAIKEEIKKFETIKIFGNKDSKNLIIGWGSTKTAILDAICGLDYKFLQVLYMKPMSDQIREEIKKAERVILVENNLTGQLGRILRSKTGIKIKDRILKYDGRPFNTCELRTKLESIK